MKPRYYISVLAAALLAAMLVGSVSSAGAVVYLPLVMNASSSTPAATSLQLIDQALAAGKIDAATAAIYKVYTVLPNSPLPGEYRGAADVDVDIAPFRALGTVYATLTAGQKAAVGPYLMRPDNPKSAFFHFQQEQQAAQQRSTDHTLNGMPLSSTRPPDSILWGTINSLSGVTIHYRVNIDGDEALAAGVAAAIDGKIYAALNTLMGRVWLDDSGCAGGGVSDDGGTGALDVYLMHGMTDRGLEESCHYPPTPGWVVLNADRILGDETHAGIIQTAAHEMFHAIQDSYDYLEDAGTYLWVQEATAKWVEDYVYPKAQSEHSYAHLYLDQTAFSMPVIPDGQRYYGEYLWPFYLYRVKGYDPVFVRNMFASAASYSSVSIFTLKNGNDSPVSLFPDFAVRNWNWAPFDNYQTKDSLIAHAKIQRITHISDVTQKQPYTMQYYSGGYDGLTAAYFDYVFDDDSARTVTFYNGISNTLSLKDGLIGFVDHGTFYNTQALENSQFEGLNVQALIEIDDVWTLEDWSLDSSKVYCRERSAQNLQELVIIITNSNYKESQDHYHFVPPDKYPLLQVSPVGCYQWKGTYDVTYNNEDGVTHTITGHAVFEASDQLYGPNVIFSLKSGDATLNMSGTNTDGMKFSANGTVNFTPGERDSFLITYNMVTGGPHPNAFYGSGATNQTVPGTTGCYCGEDGAWETYPTDFGVGPWFLAPDPTTGLVQSQAQANVIDGRYTIPNGDITYHWHFEAQAQP